MIHPHLTDVIIFADREKSEFTDFHVITSKGHFLSMITQRLSAEIIMSNDVLATHRATVDLISSEDIAISEFVDFDSHPPTVCVHAENVDVDVSYRAAELVSESIRKLGGSVGKYTYNNPVRYSIIDVAHLLHRH